MSDPVFDAVPQQQLQQAAALARASDLLSVVPVAKDRYIAQYKCKGLVRDPAGEIVEAADFAVGIWFYADYLGNSALCNS